MIGWGWRGGEACGIRGVFRSSILVASGCPIGREDQAARVCRWDALMQGMLVYTLQRHLCRDVLRLGRKGKRETAVYTWRHKIRMAALGRDSRDSKLQGYQQQPVHATRKKEHYRPGRSLGREEPSR